MLSDLRTKCNQKGFSCRDSKGRYLPKNKLIKLLGGSVPNNMELVDFNVQVNLYNSFIDDVDIDNEQQQVVVEWIRTSAQLVIDELLEDEVNIRNFNIVKYDDLLRPLTFHILYEVDPETLDGLDIESVNQRLSESESQLYFYNGSFHLDKPNNMEIPDEDIYFARASFL